VLKAPRRSGKAFVPKANAFLAMKCPSSRLFAAHMKKMFLLSTLASFAMICSCQRQDSAAEAQLAQRKSELDARETALGEREKTLDARERALAEREKATANTSTIRPELQSPRQIPNAAEAKTERDRRIQQLPPEIRALVLDPSRVKAENSRDKRDSSDPAEAQAARDKSSLYNQRQLSPEDLQREWQRKLDQAKTSGEEMSPAPEDASLTPSPTPQ
jgi:hypothetical protein